MRSLLAPDNLKDRLDVYRFFNGISAEGKDGIDAGRTRVPLVKTFLLEHVASRAGRQPKNIPAIFGNLRVNTDQLDESFYSVTSDITDPETKRTSRGITGFLEAYDERFFAYYTCEDSAIAKKRFSKWIQHPDLDATWFSSPLLQAIWDDDVSKRGDDRFANLVFKHESIFEMPEDSAAQSESDEENDEIVLPDIESDEDKPERERRNARFQMGDRIGRIKASLGNLQSNYAPLYVLHRLRLPSQTCRGGHDLSETGQITNRTDSFEDHRNTARYLYGIYKSVLDYTEKQAWQAVESPQRTELAHLETGGAPLIVRFGEPLSEATFNRWIDMAFRKRNRFKLWGQPIKLGPTKVHVYGADRHLWQPINLEITESQLVAVLPRGTCGNTFHRLVANIQHYVSPKIEAWLGAEPFKTVVSKWPTQLESANEP